MKRYSTTIATVVTAGMFIATAACAGADVNVGVQATGNPAAPLNVVVSAGGAVQVGSATVSGNATAVVNPFNGQVLPAAGIRVTFP